MKPIDVTEKLLFNTIMLVTASGTGTGFFHHFKFGDKIVPVIVTNKHVVNYKKKETVVFTLHLVEDNGDVSGKYDVEFKDMEWIFHSTQDLCFAFANPLLEYVKKTTGKNVYHIGTDDSIIYDPKKLEELIAFEKVIMVGYPLGLYDKINNLPLLRNGFTSFHPAYDFNEKGIGVVDMACFPGSSGSPIFIYNDSGFKNKINNSFNLGGRIIFLGVLYAGPTMTAEGDIVVTNDGTSKVVSKTTFQINLGYYIKAYEILEFKEYVKKIIESN